MKLTNIMEKSAKKQDHRFGGGAPGPFFDRNSFITKLFLKFLPPRIRIVAKD
jgi:hypothetical protein